MQTLRDVAKRAEVSVSTVSRYFNEPDALTDQMRERVRLAVQALQYRPSRVARRLRSETGRTHMIGLVIPDMKNPFFADIARGVEDVALERDSAVLVCNSDEDAEKEALYLDLLRAESVDGIILPPIKGRDAAVDELARTGMPLVSVDRKLSKISIDHVVADNQSGACEAVEHLIGHGHRRIGYIGGIPNLSTTKERFRGYADALADADIELDDSLVREGDSKQESGRVLTGELLDMANPPTAIFVGNNMMTLGALVAIHTRELRIPDDIAIVCFDDMPWALALNPPLTAVSQPGYEMGRRAADMLFQRISHPEHSPSLVVLQPKLIIRRSCGAHESHELVQNGNR